MYIVSTAEAKRKSLSSLGKCGAGISGNKRPTFANYFVFTFSEAKQKASELSHVKLSL